MTEPLPTPEEINRLQEEIKNETIALTSAIGKVTAAWGSLEDSLHEMFAELSGLAGIATSGVIFYAPPNTETRIRIVDSLVAYHFDFNRKTDEQRVVSEAWGKIKGKINALKNTRNAIAHGMIVHTQTTGVLTQRPRLTTPIADTLRFWPSLKAGQYFGMGSNEVLTHLAAVHRIDGRVRNFTKAVRLTLKRKSGFSQEEELLLAEMLSDLTSAGSSENVVSSEQRQSGE